MAERHAKDYASSTRVFLPILMSLFFLLQTITPMAAADANEFDDMVLCSSPLGLGGLCDDRTDADDGTNGDSWVEGMYYFNMTSTTTLQFEASWAIREWDKSALGMFSSSTMATALLLDNIGADDGLPADVLRASLDNNTDPTDPNSSTVEEVLLEQIDGSVSTLLASWGSATTPVTNWTDRITLPDGFGGSTNVDCTIDHNESQNGNSFDPPICIRTNVTITLPISTYGNTLSGVTAENLERAYEAMLVMGARVTTSFTVAAEPGFKGTYAIQPPSYATIAEVQGTYAQRVFHNASDPYHSGLWVIDNLNPTGSGASSLTGNLVMMMAFRETSFTSTVDIDSDERSLDLSVVLDMTDEQSVSIEVTAGIYQVQATTLSDWEISLMSPQIADIPVITSDGIRMAYHTGLLDIADLAEAMPIGGIGDALASSSPGLSITMGSFQWVSIAQSPLSTGGLNYTHVAPCLKGGNFCTEGAVAMDGSYPVYLQSTSHTFPLSLAELFGGNLGEDAGFLNDVTGDDLSKILNSGLEFSTVLSDDVMESFIGGMLPDDLSVDLTFEIRLPTWASTKDGGTSIVLGYRMSGNHIGDVSLTGSDSFDWEHPLCSDDGTTCSDNSQDAFCTSTMKSCARTTIDLDISEFSVANLLLSKGITMEFALTINMSIHRIGLPPSALDSLNTDTTNISLEVLPSDLLKLIVDVAGRGEDPFEFEFAICDTGKSYCDQNIQFSTSGLEVFASNFGNDLTSYIHDTAFSMQSDQNSSFGKLDLFAFHIETTLTGLNDTDDSVGDEEGISLSVHIPRVRVTAGLDNTWGEIIAMLRGDGSVSPKLGVDTSNVLIAPFLNPMIGAMDGLTGALTAGLVSADGVTAPPVEVPTGGFNTTLNEEMGLSVTGEVKLRLPLGIVLQNITSKDGQITEYIEDDDAGKGIAGRQVIVYKLMPGAQVGGDELSFNPMIGWNWILQQVIYYIGAILLFFAWRMRSRGVKRKRKRRQMEIEFMTEAAENVNRVYVPPAPTVEVLMVADNGIVIKRRLAVG
jgi:hypothetical protein